MKLYANKAIKIIKNQYPQWKKETCLRIIY